MSYVDSMIATAGIPEVPPVPSGQVWARETGQWVPITPQTGVFLPLSGGSMVGNIQMSGNTINGLAAVPSLPNGAAPAQWVLNQIASVSLFQGQWDADTNVPDLTQLSVRVNGYTWIAITTAPGGVVVGPAIPGLQGKTVFNGDTIYYSTVDGAFFAIHAGGLTLPEAQSLFVLLAGSQMSGPLLLNANASQPLQAVTLQQLQAFVPPGAVSEAPNDGQLYGRNGLTASWAPVLPLAGGILTGALTLAGNATANLNPVPLQQMTSAITAATAGYLPLAGGTMIGLFNLSGNATGNLNAVPLQQLNSMLATYAPLQNAALTGSPTAPTVTPATTSNTQIATTAFVHSTLSGAYLPLTGGTLAGPGNLTVDGILYIGNSGQFFLQDQPGTGRVVVWQASGSWFDFWNAATGLRSFAGNNQTLMTLDGSGNLNTTGGINAVGTVTAAGLSTQGAVSAGNVSASVASIGGVTMNGGGGLLSLNCWPTADNTGAVGWPGAVWFQMHSYDFAQASGEALKTDITRVLPGDNVPDVASEIMALSPATYRWRSGADTEHLHWGFIAGDVANVFGEEFGGYHNDGEGNESLSYNDLVAVLWRGVQQLTARVAALEGAA